MPGPGEALLDRYIADPDVRERFETRIRAPAAVVMGVATGFDMQSLRSVRAILHMREALLGSKRPEARRPQGIVDETLGLGWGVLSECPDRYVVVGATCQPWLADVRFTAVDPREFATHSAPDRVKIAWTLEADEVAPGITSFAQETRAVATDAAARAKFLRYWRWARFGIVGIRLLMLPAVRRCAEKRWAAESGRGRA